MGRFFDVGGGMFRGGVTLDVVRYKRNGFYYGGVGAIWRSHFVIVVWICAELIHKISYALAFSWWMGSRRCY